MSERTWVIDGTQAPGVYALSFRVGRQLWRHGDGTEPFSVSAGAEITGSLEQFEQLARDILADCGAIRADERAGREG